MIPIISTSRRLPFDAIVKPAYTRQFAYLDKTWLSENRVGMRLTWLKHKLLTLVGLGHLRTAPPAS